MTDERQSDKSGRSRPHCKIKSKPLHYNDEIKRGDLYFDGAKYISVLPRWIGQYVAKNTAWRFRRPT